MKMILGFQDGLYAFDARAGTTPSFLFPGVQPLSVAVDPSDGQCLYCATYDRGLWRSNDGGATWRPAGTPQNYFKPPTGGTIDTRKTTIVSVDPRPEADGRHAVWVGTEPSRLYRSTDGGETFACASPLDLPSRAQWSFPPRPDSHHVQCITKSRDGRMHVAIEAGATLVSRDGGRTFADRLPDSPIDTHVLLTHPMAPGRLYAALGDGVITSGHSFAESGDDGESWRYVARGLEAMPYLYGLALNPADPGDMRVAASSSPRAAHGIGGASIFRRDGDVWVEDAAGFPSDGLIPVVAADPETTGGWFALSNHGLFAKAPDAGEWRRLAALPRWRGVHPTALTILRGHDPADAFHPDDSPAPSG